LVYLSRNHKRVRKMRLAAKNGLVWFGLVWFGVARFGLAFSREAVTPEDTQERIVFLSGVSCTSAIAGLLLDDFASTVGILGWHSVAKRTLKLTQDGGCGGLLAGSDANLGVARCVAVRNL